MYSNDCDAGIFEYNKLSTTTLPYGEAIIVTGDIEELLTLNQIPVDLFKVTSMTVTYTPAGRTSKTVNGTIIGTRWQVSIDPLPENAQVNFIFQFIGTLTPKGAASTIDNILKDPEFLSAFDIFKSVIGKARSEQVIAARRFVDDLIPIVSKNLPARLKIKPEDTFAGSLVSDLYQDLPSLINLRENIKYMAANKVEGVHADMFPGEAFKAAENATKTLEPEKAPAKSVNQFMTNYRKLKDALEKSIVAEATFHTDLSTSSQIKDFEKYLGLDIGAFYIPAIDELREFITLNVYWGTVEDTPRPRNWLDVLQQRVSFTLGASIGDMSDNKDSEIEGNNAFVYGFGFRVNKYVRINAGGMVYRSKDNDGLKDEYFIGPSIDLTAFKYIKELVGKEIPK